MKRRTVEQEFGYDEYMRSRDQDAVGELIRLPMLISATTGFISHRIVRPLTAGWLAGRTYFAAKTVALLRLDPPR